MRTVVIDVEGVVREDDLVMKDWMETGEGWDTAEIAPGHEAWVPDDGLLDGAPLIRLGGRTLPLPAYILGHEGERSVAATITVDEVRAMTG